MAAEAKLDMNTWIEFIQDKKYSRLFIYLKKHRVTRNAFMRQHSGCWDLQLFCMILYYMYSAKYIRFIRYINETNSDDDKLQIGNIIISIYKSIQDPKNYLYKYVIDKQFTDNAFVNDITDISSIDDLKGYQMYPMIIYTKPHGFLTYVIFHYFTIVKWGIKYYILSSWGSDTICVLPSIARIEKKEFSKLSTLLSRFNLISPEEREECMELVKKHFLENAVLMRSDPNSVKKGLPVTPKEGRRLELQTFDDKQSYHIAFINKYNETIEEMIPKEIKKNTRNTRKNRNTRNTRNTNNTHNTRNTHRNRSSSPRKN